MEVVLPKFSIVWYSPGNTNSGVLGVFLKYPHQRKILKILSSKFWEIFFQKTGKNKKFRLIYFDLALINVNSP